MSSRLSRPLAHLGALAVAVLAAGCASKGPVAPTLVVPATFSIMGESRLGADTLAAWFNQRVPRPAGVYAAGEPVEVLARYFIEEGAVEGVTGDVAFVQSVVETGWFRFGGSVPPWANNFAGIGALDGRSSFAVFSDARTGVRAQIQHLRAYADATAYACTEPPLHNPCVDPRFDLVTPKGKAATWNQLGNGNWATAPGYAESILDLYAEALAHDGQPPR